MEALRAAVTLIIRAMVLSAQLASQQRLFFLQRAVTAGDAIGELARLRDELRRVKSELKMVKDRFKEAPTRRHFTPMERLRILWHMEYYRIPRSKVTEHFLIARSTFYRWLHAAERGDLGEKKPAQESPKKTPAEMAHLIWEIFEENPVFGRKRIANILWLLGVFVAASTVRNVLLSPKPKKSPAAAKAKAVPAAPRQIVARYPNHVWSVDRTRVWRWRIWPTWVLVAIDHYSRAVMAVVPLEGPNAGWVVDALEEAFRRHGTPKHIISDQEGVFISEVFAELVRDWDLKHRFGAVGKHGSIAVTERVILTLKQEWLRRVPVIRDFAHLSQLLGDFELYYNEYRGHARLGGAVPARMHRGEEWERPEKSAKTVPINFERRVFPDTKITAYRLAA